METVYRLRDCEDSLRQMQEASLSHPFLGLKITHGLVGTEEWWHNIATGKLHMHRVRGVVRGLWLGMYNSEPGTFAMALPDGSIFNAMTSLEAAESIEKFVLGRVVEVDYVLQETKNELLGSPDGHRVMLEIRLDAMVVAGVQPLGQSYFTWRASQGGPAPDKASGTTIQDPRRTRWWQVWR